VNVKLVLEGRFTQGPEGTVLVSFGRAAVRMRAAAGMELEVPTCM
jgi:hypothetical protein